MSSTPETCLASQYPKEIKMSGLPWAWYGWNSKFVKTEEMSEGAPVYHMDTYVLFWTIPIVGASIRLFRTSKEDPNSATWVLMRDCDFNMSENIVARKLKVTEKYGDDDDLPCGAWQYGGKVSSNVGWFW